MTGRPNDVEPGGRLYRVRVLIPMQERHWALGNSLMKIGLLLLLPATLLFALAVERDGSVAGSILAFGPVTVYGLGVCAWTKWADRKRARLRDEHLRLVERFGTSEVRWTPPVPMHGGFYGGAQ